MGITLHLKEGRLRHKNLCCGLNFISHQKENVSNFCFCLSSDCKQSKLLNSFLRNWHKLYFSLKLSWYTKIKDRDKIRVNIAKILKA